MKLNNKEADALRSILKRAADHQLKELVIQVDETDYLVMRVQQVLPGDRQYSLAPVIRPNVFCPAEPGIKA